MQIALHHEAQCGKLTGPIGNDGVDTQHAIADEEGLEAGKRAADAQVDFLSGVGGLRLVLVGRGERANRLKDVIGDECREVGTYALRKYGGKKQDMDNANGLVYAPHTIDHLERNVLSLAIAIQPQTQRLATAGFLLNLLYTSVKCVPSHCISASCPLSPS